MERRWFYMPYNIQNICEIIEQMEKQLQDSLLYRDGKLQTKKLWKNTHIKKQIDRRNSCIDIFSIQEHIRGIVYSMLSSGISWERVEKSVDEDTGRITILDNIFHQYEPEYLLSYSPEKLTGQIKEIGCASQSTGKQMKGLIQKNIPKMMELERNYGSIDQYYQKFIENDPSKKSLVKDISNPRSADKYIGIGEALAAEYLRNVGYDLAKPDRHIRRILGRDYLGCSENKIASVEESFDIVQSLSEYMGRETIAEVDYILWSYCARGYGEICTLKKPKCSICVAKRYCKGGSNL